MPNLDELGLVVSKKRAGALERKSSRQMRPWRSPTASWRCGEEFSLSRRWWGREMGDHLTAVMKGEAAEEGGGGRGRVETSCIEWVSRMATELPAA